MNITQETPGYVRIDWHSDGRSSKENKYLCIGGPFDGQKKSYSQIVDTTSSYTGYNCAENPRFVSPHSPKKVWVHTTILNQI
jgi:hypothetical protein